MKTTRGPQYGSLGILILTLVVGTDLLVACLVMVGLPPAWLIGSTIATLFGALWIYKSSNVEVNDAGVTIIMIGGAAMNVAWPEIEKVQKHRLGVWLVLHESHRRVMFSGLDPRWRTRPVSKAILAQIGS